MLETTDTPTEALPIKTFYRRRALAELDYLRELRRLTNNGHTDKEISRWLRIREEEVSASRQAAENIDEVVDGFCGSSPLEICQRYATGLIPREQLIEELVRWNYPPGGETDGYDSFIIEPPGAWSELFSAIDRGFIDRGVYGEVLNRINEPGTDK